MWRFMQNGAPNLLDIIIGSGLSARGIQSGLRTRKTRGGADEGGNAHVEKLSESNYDVPDDLCYSEGLQYELNDDQEAAVRSALVSDTYHLVHGPPGTGKTRTLARLIRACLDNGERLLVACPTNVAVAIGCLWP